MALDIVGKLVQKLEIQSGEGARGTWSRQDAIFETIEQYPRKICISFWSERISDLDRIKLGDTVTVGISIESREFSGKWYTSVRAWRVQFADAGANQPHQASAAQPAAANVTHDVAAPANDDFIDSNTTEIDDLPF